MVLNMDYNILSFHVELFIIRVFNVLLSSAKKVDELKECFMFLEILYPLLRHVPNRFFALFSAVDRLLKPFTAIKYYSLSKGDQSDMEICYL